MKCNYCNHDTKLDAEGKCAFCGGPVEKEPQVLSIYDGSDDSNTKAYCPEAYESSSDTPFSIIFIPILALITIFIMFVAIPVMPSIMAHLGLSLQGTSLIFGIGLAVGFAVIFCALAVWIAKS